MATKIKVPTTFHLVTREGKVHKFELADKYDSWGSKYDDTVLEIEDVRGKVHFWPMDLVKTWILIPKALSAHA